MSYVFRDPEDTMQMFFKYIASAREGGPYWDRQYHLALMCLVGVFNEKAHIAAERLRQFKDESAVALAGFGNTITAFVHIATFLAEDAHDDEWDELCMRRSAIQLILDEYAGTPLAAMINPGDVADLDVELQRVGKDQGPLPEQYVLKGLPESHWWWHFPHDEKRDSEVKDLRTGDDAT